MKPDTPQPSREEIEVRLTAWILGELSAEEAEQMSLPSGVYFYQLIAGEFTSMKKMILMK